MAVCKVWQILNNEKDEKILHDLYTNVVETLKTGLDIYGLKEFARTHLDPDASFFGRALGCAFVGVSNPHRCELYMQCMYELESGRLSDGTIVPDSVLSVLLKTTINLATVDDPR